MLVLRAGAELIMCIITESDHKSNYLYMSYLATTNDPLPSRLLHHLIAIPKNNPTNDGAPPPPTETQSVWKIILHYNTNSKEPIYSTMLLNLIPIYPSIALTMEIESIDSLASHEDMGLEYVKSVALPHNRVELVVDAALQERHSFWMRDSSNLYLSA